MEEHKIGGPRAWDLRSDCCEHCTGILSQGAPAPSYLDSVAAAKNNDVLPCACCLGFFGRFAASERWVCDELISTIAGEGHSLEKVDDSFDLAVTLPANQLIRSVALRHHYRASLGQDRIAGTDATSSADSHDMVSSQATEIPDIKSALRKVLINIITEKTGAQYDAGSPLKITLVFDHASTAAEYPGLGNMRSSRSKPSRRKRRAGDGGKGYSCNDAEESSPPGHSLRAVNELLVSSCKNDLADCGLLALPKRPVTNDASCTIKVRRASVLVQGCYQKFSREVSQSPWSIEGRRKTEMSVSEALSAPLQDHYTAEEAKFDSAGREDVDVRMLGNGRPFIVELVNPRLQSLQAEFFTRDTASTLLSRIGRVSMSLVLASKLSIADETSRKTLREGAESHRKRYRCVVVTQRPVGEDDIVRLSLVSKLVLEQDTPLRVLHRRTRITRSRTVHKLGVRRLTRRSLIVDVDADAGTYIKEFVHGDFGRTRPNVSELIGARCDIIQLDVVGLVDS